MITLIGIGHVFSIREAVKYIIHGKKPNAVCVELDKYRYKMLKRGIRDTEGLPLVYKRLQKIYDRAAELQGADVGEEMIAAVDAAEELGIPHYFIDVEAGPMVKDNMKAFTLGQKIKLFSSVLGASILPKKTLEKGIKAIEKNPELAMKEFEKRFPDLKRDLIDYRDRYMADGIKKLSNYHSDMAVVIGEGHMPGITRQLKGFDVESVHLNKVLEIAKKLENGSIDGEDSHFSNQSTLNRNRSINFSFNINIEE